MTESEFKDLIRSFVESPDWRQKIKDVFAVASEDMLAKSMPLPSLAPIQTEEPPEPLDSELRSLVSHPSVTLILGHRGSGKSALANRIQELLRNVAAPYAVGLPPKAGRLLPAWYGLADDFADVPSNAVIYVPESYRIFHARGSQTAQGRAIGDLVNLSRHRRHTLIFDVQNPAHLDRNIISEADVVMVKEPGPLTRGFERPQLRPIMDAARAAFAGVGPYRRKRAVWVVAPSEGVSGQLMENVLPTFWTDSLSRIFGEALPPMAHMAARSDQRTAAAGRRGRRTVKGGEKTYQRGGAKPYH